MFGRGKQPEPTRRSPAPQRQTPESFSYYRSNRRNQTMGDMRRQDIATAERRDVVKLVKLAVVVLVIVVALGKLLYVTSSANVSLPTEGYGYREPSEYSRIVNEGLKRSAWNGNKLTFDDIALKEYLAEQLPELQQAEIIIPLINNRPVIKLSFLPAGMVLANGRDAYVVTNTGRIVAKLDEDDASHPSVPQVNDAAGTTYDIGTYGFAESSVQFINELHHQFEAKKIGIVSMTIPAGAIEELRVVPTGVGYSVRFDMTNEAVLQAGNYLAARDYLKDNALIPREYVDARVSGKVFFK